MNLHSNKVFLTKKRKRNVETQKEKKNVETQLNLGILATKILYLLGLLHLYPLSFLFLGQKSLMLLKHCTVGP